MAKNDITAPAADEAANTGAATAETPATEAATDETAAISDDEKAKTVASCKKILDIMSGLNVSKLWTNKADEYFTSENLAHLSEGGKKENVSIINKSELELTIKSLQ